MFVCVCVCVCVCRHVSLNTHLQKHNNASPLFPSSPLDSFSTLHHSNSPCYTSPPFSLPSVFPLAGLLPPLSLLHCVLLESIVPVHLFHLLFCPHVSVRKKSTVLLLSGI